MLNAMLKTKEVLDGLKIPFWLDCGTLLKMYRDKKPDMTDCDMAVSEKDAHLLLGAVRVFLDNGFKFYNIWTHPLKGMTELTLCLGTNKIDLFVKFEQGKWVYTISSCSGRHIVAKQPKKYLYPLTVMNILDTEWTVPNDTEKYLEVYYGKNWRIPIDEWDWTKDAPCIDRRWKI
jgi:hypothetical protein